MNTLNCAGCGGLIRELFDGPKLVACEYCGSFLVLEHGSLKVAGRARLLKAMPSHVGVEKSIRFLGREFLVVGRARYAYEDGLWDEWQLVDTNGEKSLLQEDEGELWWWSSAEAQPFADLGAVRPGSRWRDILVSEIGRAELVGAQGALDRVRAPDEAFDYLDGHQGSSVVSFRSWPDRSLVLRGQPIAQWVTS